MPTESPRSGARRRADISPQVLAGLNRGRLQSANLVEGLAVDFAVLLKVVMPGAPRAVIAQMREAAGLGITQRMALAARLVLAGAGPTAYASLARHRSDTVRGWAAYLLASVPELTLAERLWLARPLANDSHFGVREWAWCALRPHIAGDIVHAIDLLSAWTASDSPFLRRFASESTRPRGVWCAHIPRLKADPSLGLPILEPLRSDPHPYVQASVGNWLRDAAKSLPEWVSGQCARWLKESPTPATRRICRRAQA